jgi:hypothetical protein
MMPWHKVLVVAIVLASLAVSTGCRSFSFSDPVIGPSYKPKNIFSKAGPWPREIRRVAILPMAYNENQPNTVSGRDLLEPILHTELAKAQRFECISVSAEFVKKWTHKEKWSATEMLPGDMIQILKTELGCDAVMFPELTQYRPYPPLVIGWNMKLVSVSTQEILWAVDETFDAGELPVANAARRFEMQREQPNPVLAESRQVLISPRRFGQFTAKTLVASIPEYKESPISTQAAHRAADSEAAAKAEASKIAEAKAAEVKAAEVKAAEVKAAEVKAAEVKAAEVKAAEVKAAEVKAAEVKAAEVKAAEVKAAEAKVAAAKVAAAKVAAAKVAEAKAAAAKAAASDSTTNDSTTSHSATYEVGVSGVGATRFGSSGVGGSGNRQSGSLPQKGASEQSSAENDKR